MPAELIQHAIVDHEVREGAAHLLSGGGRNRFAKRRMHRHWSSGTGARPT